MKEMFQRPELWEQNASYRALEVGRSPLASTSYRPIRLREVPFKELQDGVGYRPSTSHLERVVRIHSHAWPPTQSPVSDSP